MLNYSNSVLDASGNAAVSATVTVKNYPSGTNATIYSDNGVTPKTNPITTDSSGGFSFYAANGRYTLTVIYAGVTVNQTDSIYLYDMADASFTQFQADPTLAIGIDVAARADNLGMFRIINYARNAEQIAFGSLTSPNDFDVATGTARSIQVKIINTATANRYLTLTGSVGGNPTIGVSAGSLNIGANATFYNVASQYNAFLNARAVSCYEFGYNNTAGYGSVLGADGGSGAPFIAFNAGPGSTNNTYRTFGLRGHIVKSDNDGALTFSSLNTASADNQTSYEQVRILRTDSANRYITLTGSNGGSPTISTSAGDLLCGTNFSVSGRVSASSYISAHNSTATPAGGAANTCFFMGSANIGIYWGSGAPTVSAAQGSIYLRTDGGASTRIYSNNNGSTGWSAITSA